jgi:hypothetical protein
MSCGFKSDNKVSEETVAQQIFPELVAFVKYVKTEDLGVLPWWPMNGMDARENGKIIPIVLSGRLWWRRCETPTTPEAKSNYTIRTAILGDYTTFREAFSASSEQNRIRSTVRKLRNRRPKVKLLTPEKMDDSTDE